MHQMSKSPNLRGMLLRQYGTTAHILETITRIPGNSHQDLSRNSQPINVHLNISQTEIVHPLFCAPKKTTFNNLETQTLSRTRIIIPPKTRSRTINSIKRSNLNPVRPHKNQP
uniref:Uncharacterized protein n=1 Tax=Kalanchoe fedtschenkoi TaxID=63787 RepID=A0A7N0UG97_KALFE